MPALIRSANRKLLSRHSTTLTQHVKEDVWSMHWTLTETDLEPALGMQVVMTRHVRILASSQGSAAHGKCMTKPACHTGAASKMTAASPRASGSTALCFTASPLARAGRTGADTSLQTSKALGLTPSTFTRLIGRPHVPHEGSQAAGHANKDIRIVAKIRH